MAASTAAALRAIVKDFPNGGEALRVLHGVDLDLTFGQTTFLVGPSGSGKTTLLSILSGTLSPTSGSVEVLGERLERLSGDQLVRFRRRNIGFVFQQYNLVSTLSAAENAAIPLLADGQNWGRATSRARELLDSVGLSDHLDKLPRQLSGGQQQRVAIARALVHSPALIVCDEPTAALDAAAGRRVMELLTGAAARPDSAVLVVTHDDRIFPFSDVIYEMEDGRLSGVRTSAARNPS